MRIATWNVNSLNARLPRVEEWLAYADSDVVCLQETKLADAVFPAMAFAALGYESVHSGAGRWNGVAILSRVGLDQPRRELSVPGGAQLAEGRFVSARCGGLSVASVYVPNGRSVGSEHYEAKLAWLGALHDHVAATATGDLPLAICGDFNVAPEDRDVWDVSAFVGATHVSPAERAALARLAGRGLVDAFRCVRGEQGLFSWWDYRAGDFHQHRGMRIDLVLVSASLAGRVRWALIDRNARKGRLPSDHAPLVVDLADSA
ncbi:MAG: exodeoxyribonuclease III [Acidimicrobiales bacterium]